jgi:hypothetical protein
MASSGHGKNQDLMVMGAVNAVNIVNVAATTASGTFPHGMNVMSFGY